MGIFTRRKPLHESQTHREVRANDPIFNDSFQYANNFIRTYKYTVFTFLPKNLFEQFQRIANAYFLCLLILQLIPQVSSLTPLTTIIPLIFVLTLTAVKDASDDIQRHKSDGEVNSRQALVLKDGKVTSQRWDSIHVGDIIRLESDQFVTADMLLLTSSEPNGLCYIATADLDGETNLKARQAIPDIAEMGDDTGILSSFNGHIECEKPNNNLTKFEGTLNWHGASYSLDPEKILLRGCTLRNTKWCYGIVIFAGKDTKLMRNSGKTRFKRTNIDLLLNQLVLGIFCFLFSICFLCTIGSGIWESVVGYDFQVFLAWEKYIPGSPWLGGTRQGGATAISLMVFISYLIVLNTVVPISLYVTVEFIRLGHSLVINWDVKMYHKESDTPAKSRTTTLNEELGQIEYIFSDKTGTLTQNIMTFKKCSIDSVVYGENESDAAVIKITNEPTSDLTGYKEDILEAVRNDDKKVRMFFRLLSLCHTVMSEERDGVLEYQAQSPDENALVQAAREFGFTFKRRTPTTITIEVDGRDEVYELLCILDFNNVRKRMSVILRKEGRIMLYCKGADSVIYERLSNNEYNANLASKTSGHLSTFAQDGLRTLCLAVKEIDEVSYQMWQKKHHAASIALVDREEKVSAVYEEIEGDLILLGATAIEDKLQDGVPQAISRLSEAGVKIWVLTGDKQETAINIGYSSKLLTEQMEEIFIIDADEYVEVENQLRRAREDILAFMDGTRECGVKYKNGTDASISQSLKDLGTSRSFGLVINGHSLVHSLKEEMEMLLLEVGSMCIAVICCRVTPLQKAKVVDLVKKHKQSITLAIGDGANDVSMIKSAHIGVGISGQEGLQAVLSSDFSIAQFRFLERLLLFHGRLSYLRFCKFLRYFFYKNIAFTLVHFWYAFFCGFSAQYFYDPLFIGAYNVFYTSMPVFVMAIFEQDVSDEFSVSHPKLYTAGHGDGLFNKKIFALSVLEGIITSALLYFTAFGAFSNNIHSNEGRDIIDHHAFSFAVASVLIFVVNIRCAIDTQFWTVFNHLAVWGSIVVYFIFTFFLYSDFIVYSYIGSERIILSSGQFWFTLILIVVVCILPIIGYRFISQVFNPSFNDIIRTEVVTRARSETSELSHLGNSDRKGSLRTGYAFSHTEGYGSMITSGTNMRADGRVAKVSPGDDNQNITGVSYKQNGTNLAVKI
ncbi:unnamed protein product [Owenia fusiformis]|uniref:Phospholipid-transporting ATPase n=1 Tax=Owenia fusiformis TaxID=6347 RepID=A0A8S4NZT3_OWEFU|nr:unnamed protein product [Owenia fusiformis]